MRRCTPKRSTTIFNQTVFSKNNSICPIPAKNITLPGIIIQTVRPHVETLLAPYRETIGRDYLGYRNHVYRAITYALHFLNGQHEQLVETVFVYHDMGLWTARELAYLEPSESLAVSDNEKFGWGLDPVVLRDAIHWHHKIFRYRGPNEAVIEACRKADWIDATQGLCARGLVEGIFSEWKKRFRIAAFMLH